jgi:hypothetical protein
LLTILIKDRHLVHVKRDRFISNEDYINDKHIEILSCKENHKAQCDADEENGGVSVLNILTVFPPFLVTIFCVACFFIIKRKNLVKFFSMFFYL